MLKKVQRAAVATAVLAFSPTSIWASPTVEQALALKPIQVDVDYDIPTAESAAKCKIEAARDLGSGWIVREETGQMLRRFLDTNNDKKLDQWSYFKDGIEVYRDVDANFNGKADQYRWLGTSGTRWGLDKNEDGVIDSWKVISPEETTAEVVAALREGDAGRFTRLLLTTAELAQLGVGKSLEADLASRIKAAEEGAAALVKSQKMVTGDSKWLQFGGTRPGVIPIGADGATKDLVAYDNAAAIVDSAGKHSQVSIGTLVRLGDGWRLIDLPKSEASAGFFYTSVDRAPDVIEGNGSNLSSAMQSLIGELEKIDKQLTESSDSTSLAKLNQSRADVLEKIANQSTSNEERATWTRQFADSVSAAIQSGEYPDGVNRLKKTVEDLARDRETADLVPYVKFQYLSADYSQKLQSPNADFAKIQEQWLKDLEDFSKEYPKSDAAPDALLQLAIAYEFAGQETDAGKWYSKVVSDFASSPMAAKAAGAKRRLESVGRSIELQGKTHDGRSLDLAAYRGKAVLIHYWATWCEPCKEDLKEIKALQARYAAKGFAAIGINLDSDAKLLTDYLRENSLSWPQLYESGGLDSRLANELGIMTVPTMLLIDKSGQVVRRNVHSAELDAELQRLLK
ncbi:MAG: redoxin family protein [Planctomycetaceae bacterium]|nr:redoxin family protein [Planctomycetales bacterium]MCB9936738.1 redoxin family protein [Planctomycetaceae bacterium]